TLDDVSTANLKKLNPQVKVFYRAGRIAGTLREFNAEHDSYREPDKNIHRLPMNMYRREYRRLVGDVKFDVAVEFNGYSRFWALVFLNSGSKRRVTFQHNHMMNEYEKIVGGKQKHKANLGVIFRLYEKFDKVLSVSRATMEVNAAALSRFVPPEKFGAVPNMINAEVVV